MHSRSKSKNSIFEKKVIIFDEFADALALSKSGKELDIYEVQEVGTYKLTAELALAGVAPQVKTQRVKTGVYKSLEENLRILLQKGRSLGYRITAATQRASTKIITGDTKTNMPVQICFRAVSYTHLRAHETVLDLVCRLLLEKKQNNTSYHDHL